MIDAKELRIGNLIARKNYLHDYLRVEQIKWQSQIYFIRYRDKDDIGGESAVENFAPIPLTPELLEACGFDHVYEAGGWCNKYHIIYSREDGGWELHPFCTIDTDVQIKLKYLHQLQNLEYVLTGTELEVNLNKEKV